tara:strand:- start:9037 stop:9615 length:579 start_codon:yes stop_codon:yes gene_type:complete
MLNIKDVENTLNLPAEKWKGHCHAIACQIVKAGLVEGRAVYGHYLGNVKEGTFFSKYPIVQHGWIETKDGKVIDPTRWFFEDVEPYIYCEDKNEEYDEGGNKYRMDNLKDKPEYNPNSKQLTVNHTQDELVIRMALDLDDNCHSISIEEAFWLANLPLPMLEGVAKPIYSFLEKNGMKAFIPLDNYNAVFNS